VRILRTLVGGPLQTVRRMRTLRHRADEARANLVNLGQRRRRQRPLVDRGRRLLQLVEAGGVAGIDDRLEAPRPEPIGSTTCMPRGWRASVPESAPPASTRTPIEPTPYSCATFSSSR